MGLRIFWTSNVSAHKSKKYIQIKIYFFKGSMA